MKILNRGRRAEVFGALCLSLVLLGLTAAESPIADAAMNGDVESVRLLIRSGEEVNAAQGDGMTALHWAARLGGIRALKMKAKIKHLQ